MDTHNSFKKLLGFSMEGFFNFPIEEQDYYKDVVYDICSTAVKEITEEYDDPNDDVLVILLISLQQVEQTFNQVEEYEMSFLIKDTIEKIINEERKNI